MYCVVYTVPECTVLKQNGINVYCSKMLGIPVY